jgi:ADP-ribosyl-[dinitrogen reductase] hydrolase
MGNLPKNFLPSEARGGKGWMIKDMSPVESIRGGIYGLAVGDALGAAVEFMTKEEIQARYGVLQDIVGGGWLNLRAGDWTDDTEMALAVAEGVAKDPENPVPYIGEAFLRWRATNPPDIGGTVRAVFHAYDLVKDWHRAAKQIHARTGKTAGNGALMRTLPLAFVYQDVLVLFTHSMEVARMTHWDPEAGLTCYLYCLVAQGFLRGREFGESYNNALDILRKVIPCAEVGEVAAGLIDKLAQVASWPAEALKPTGYTVDTLACALWCVANSKSFEEAVVKAVNLGGDADTVGAVTGGLAGVMYGYEAIPDRWVAQFTSAQRERLEGAVAGLIRLAPENAGAEGIAELRVED